MKKRKIMVLKYNFLLTGTLPDNDSAFCDNTSSYSGSDMGNGNVVPGGGGGSAIVSENDPILKSSVVAADAMAQAKAEKIKLAIEKIKEASIKKIFIKVFGEDGSAKSLLGLFHLHAIHI